MKVEDGIKLDFDSVLFKPKRSTLTSRKQVDLHRTYTFRNSGKEYYGIPIMAANMDGVGTFNMARALQEHHMFTCLVKSYTLDDWKKNIDSLNTNHCAVSTGIGDAAFNNLKVFLKNFPEVTTICIDVANGYSEAFGDFVEQVRNDFPSHIIIAGNVVTADMTQELILRGADIVKVGVGPGSVCTTRIQTGVGYPQLSAIAECADAAHGLGGHIIADGGCTCPGDVAKAFGAGADFVMLGGMLSGHVEGGGEVITKYFKTNQLHSETTIDPKNFTPQFQGNPIIETKKFVKFYGMSSDTAMNKHNGGVAEYRSSEGRTVEVPFKGNVETTVLDILGGVRSTCTYVGASSLKHLSKCTTFIRVGRQFNTSLL